MSILKRPALPAQHSTIYSHKCHWCLVRPPPPCDNVFIWHFFPHQHIDVFFMFDCCMMPHFCVMPHFASQLFFFCCVLCGVVWKGLRVDRLRRQLKNRVPTCVVSLSPMFSLHDFSASHIPSRNLDFFAHCVFQSRIPNRSVHFK